jgi:hypothetical protein
MQKLIFSLLITFLLGLQASFAQSYVLSGIEKTDKEGMQYEVIGKVANHYWIFKKNAGVSTIALYNGQMQLVKQNDLAFIPASIRDIQFSKGTETVSLFYQFQANSTVYAAKAELNADGQLIGQPKIIDTADNVRPGSNPKVFNLLESDDHSQLKLFSVNTTKANSIKVKVLTLNRQFEIINEVMINVNAQNKKSVLSDFAIDNKGNLFCLRNMTLANTAPAVSLLYLSTDGSEVVESPILNTTLLLDDIRLKVDNANGRVILNSFYAVEKKGNVEGVFSYIWDISSKKEFSSNASRFTDALRATVSSKRNLKGVFDNFYLDKINIQADGSFVAIAEAAETYNNRSAFSRWDYFYGGPFYNPFMFSYWNRPFGFYPWARFGWGMSPFMWNPWMNPYAGFGYSSVTYNANKIALITIDTKGSIQSIKTIDKSQSDMNVDQFIGYGFLESSNGSTFVYQQKAKRVSQFILNSFSNQGVLSKGANLILAEKNYEWMPRSLKQTGENEAIVPYQYKNRIGFAKIQIK